MVLALKTIDSGFLFYFSLLLNSKLWLYSLNQNISSGGPGGHTSWPFSS